MVNEKTKTAYFQRLPHLQPKGAAFFVTFRLFGSIPKSNMEVLKCRYEEKLIVAQKSEDTKDRRANIHRLRKQYFAEYDRLLDKIESGPVYLAQDSIAEIVSRQIHRFDREFYNLICCTIMSNHVHMLIDTDVQLNENMRVPQLTEKYTNLDQIMKRIKGASARYANVALGRKGQFWERESYDMYIRNERMAGNVVSYILSNPIKAGMADSWEKYKWNYLCDH